MSARVVLTADQLRDLSTFLIEASKLTRNTKVSMCAYGAIDVSVAGNMIRVAWEDDREYGEYVVDDQVGS